MQDMTKGNPLRIILAFAVPLLLTNVCQQCYRIADAAVVGRFLGETALSSVGGASEPLLFMTISFFLGISYGLPIVTGQCYGAKDYVNVRRSIALSLVIACGLSLPLMIAAGFTTDLALHLMKTPEKFMEGASYYMKILYFCGVINVLLLLMTSIIRVLGDSKTPLYLMICSCILNVCLNILFVAVFDWGIPGVAWATVSAQFLPCILCVIYFRKRMAQFFPHLSDFRWSWHFIREHLRVALPSGFQTVLVAAGVLIVQYAVNRCGPAAVGGISATAPLNNMFFMPLYAMGGSPCHFHRPELRSAESAPDHSRCPQGGNADPELYCHCHGGDPCLRALLCHAVSGGCAGKSGGHRARDPVPASAGAFLPDPGLSFLYVHAPDRYGLHPHRFSFRRAGAGDAYPRRDGSDKIYRF